MKKLLVIDSNVNRYRSRTKRISDVLVRLLSVRERMEVCEVILENERLAALDSAAVNLRQKATEKENFDICNFRRARQFAQADMVVISAPCWVSTFPGMLKLYLDNIAVPGITYSFGADGKPQRLCKATALWYVTTCGGQMKKNGPAFGAIRAFANLCAIPEVEFVYAQGLDLQDSDADKIVAETIEKLRKCL